MFKYKLSIILALLNMQHMQRISILCLLLCTMAINPLHAQSSELCRCYFRQGNYTTIVEEIPPFISEVQITPDIEAEIINLQAMIGESYVFLDKLDIAEYYQRAALQQALTAFGQLNEKTISLQAQLASTLGLKKEFIQAERLLKDALIGNTEALEARWSGLFFNKFIGITQHRNASIFYCKIAAAHLLFAGKLNDKTYLGEQLYEILLKVFKSILYRDRIILTDYEFNSILNNSNTPEDTPYNKGRDWMRGPEIELYARYGEVSSKLEQAGKSGTEAEKITARNDFRIWLDSVKMSLTK